LVENRKHQTQGRKEREGPAWTENKVTGGEKKNISKSGGKGLPKRR